MVILLQLSIKQELKLSEPAVQIKKDKKAVKDLMVCPKKKKRKQRSPAKVQVRTVPQEIQRFIKAKTCLCAWGVGNYFTRQIPPHLDSCKGETTSIFLFFQCRFSASMMTDHWAFRIQSVTSVFTVMLHSEPTIICRGMSSFTPVWISHVVVILQMDYFLIIKSWTVFLESNNAQSKSELQQCLLCYVYTEISVYLCILFKLQVRNHFSAASVTCASFRNIFSRDMRRSILVSK